MLPLQVERSHCVENEAMKTSEAFTQAQCLVGRRVLLVMDAALSAMLIKQILVERGGTVLGPVESTAEALTWITTEPPDAAVVDGNLIRGMIASVRAALQACAVPVVFLAGYPGPLWPEPGGTPRLRGSSRAEELVFTATALADAVTRVVGTRGKTPDRTSEPIGSRVHHPAVQRENAVAQGLRRASSVPDPRTRLT